MATAAAANRARATARRSGQLVVQAMEIEPFALAARQMEIDRHALRAVPWLARPKRRRLSPAPFAFLRGSTRLFYEILAARPDLAAGPDGDGWILGDMHLENVGAYPTDARDVVFGLNDFDEATIGPLRYDVLRFSTSVLLAARAFEATGAQAIALVEHAVAAYLQARAGEASPGVPALVAGLLDRARRRSNKKLLDDRAPFVRGRRSFVDADRYHDLGPDVLARVPALLSAYVAALGPRAPAKAAGWSVAAAAFRIAGNGSLGVLRIALLVRDQEGEERLLELKECHEPAPRALIEPPAGLWTHPGERAAAAARALCAAPPRLLAPVRLGDLSFLGRRLFPQEDKLAVRKLRLSAELDDLVSYIGHVLGESHARGVAALGGARVRPWTGGESASLIDRAVVLAGLFESIYLAWVRRDA
jgi:uncharacterized protein (DUF2252 family)